MKTLLLGIVLGALMPGASFEVVSIKPCPPGTREPAAEHSGQVQFVLPGGTFDAKCTSVPFLMEWAYGIQPVQHVGGPAWMAEDRFDVVAKATQDTSEGSMREMVKALLADRFHLRLHEEQRMMPAVVMTAGKAATKLTPSEDDARHEMRMEQKASGDGKPPVYRVLASKYTLDQVADVFGRQLGNVMLNQTGLTGAYDFELELQPDVTNPRDPALLITVMREQLGLGLKSDKVPVRILIIDAADRTDAEN